MGTVEYFDTATATVRRTSLLLLPLLLLAKAPLGRADLFTSSAKMTELAEAEESLINSVLTYNRQALDMIKVDVTPPADGDLRRFAEFRRKVIESTGRKAGESVHPNAAMLLIRAFMNKWNGVITRSPDLGKIISEHNVQLPVIQDMDGILSGILRLQRSFNLTIANIYAGDYVGFKGPGLSPLTAGALGARAFSDGLLRQSLEWLRLSLAQMRLANSVPGHAHPKTDPDDPGFYNDAQLATAEALLGRALYYSGDMQGAAQQLEQSQPLDPSNPEVLKLREELKTPSQTVYQKEDISDNMTVLCSRPKNRVVETLQSFHRCRLKASMTVPYLRFKEEIISTRPFASVFHHVIHQREIDELINWMKEKMHPATVEATGRSYIRVSERGWIHDAESPVARELSRRVQEITWLRTTNNPEGSATSEPFQILNYGTGGHYNAHIDNIKAEIPDWLRESGTRISTFLLYLTDVDIGGHTIFPKVGVSVPPVKGSALFWYNVNPAQEMEPLTLHAGCPVLKGHKWVSNKWIWTYGNMYRRPCGPRPTSGQLDVEQLMYSRRHDIF